MAKTFEKKILGIKFIKEESFLQILRREIAEFG